MLVACRRSMKYAVSDKTYQKRVDGYEGKIITAACGKDFKIISVRKDGYVDVEFLDSGHKTTVIFGSAKSGNIKDRLSPSVHGVGIVGGCFSSSESTTPAYLAWRGILSRCYSNKTKERQPSYKNATISEDWLNYSNFREWYLAEKGGADIVLEVDKDLLGMGTKVYSKETCLLLPKKINIFLTTAPVFGCTTTIKYSPIKCKYFIIVRDECGNKVFKNIYYDTYRDAFSTLATYKEGVMKVLANEYKDVLSENAYNAAINWRVLKE